MLERLNEKNTALASHTALAGPAGAGAADAGPCSTSVILEAQAPALCLRVHGRNVQALQPLADGAPGP